MKQEYLVSAMLTAFQISQHSHCVRRKAGAVIIGRDANENRPVVLGWGCNGMPTGHDTNCCELPASDDFVPQQGDPHGHLMTNPDVIHAEVRALNQAGERARGAIVVCTDTPCPTCMAALNEAGIAEFHYLFDYRLMDHLKDAKFKIIKMSVQEVLAFQRTSASALYERMADALTLNLAHRVTENADKHWWAMMSGDISKSVGRPFLPKHVRESILFGSYNGIPRSELSEKLSQKSPLAPWDAMMRHHFDVQPPRFRVMDDISLSVKKGMFTCGLHNIPAVIPEAEQAKDWRTEDDMQMTVRNVYSDPRASSLPTDAAELKDLGDGVCYAPQIPDTES